MRLFACALAGFGCATVAHAQVNHGDFSGSTVDFLNVTENSITDPGLVPLYGAPLVSGDTLSFNPLGFGAFGEDGGFDITDGTVTFQVESHQGFFIDTFVIAEQGEYTLVDTGGNGTANTWVQIAANLTVEINAIDGVSVNAINLAPEMLTFFPSDGDFNLVDDGAAVLADFSGSVMIDFEQELIDRGIDFEVGVTSMRVTMNNQLIAVSEDGTTAFIQKKDSDGTTFTITPTPGTTALMAIGLIGLARRRRI